MTEPKKIYVNLSGRAIDQLLPGARLTLEMTRNDLEGVYDRLQQYREHRDFLNRQPNLSKQFRVLQQGSMALIERVA